MNSVIVVLVWIENLMYKLSLSSLYTEMCVYVNITLNDLILQHKEFLDKNPDGIPMPDTR